MVAICLVLVIAVLSLPSAQNRWGWRLDFAWTYLRNWLNPVEPYIAVVDQGGNSTPTPISGEPTPLYTRVVTRIPAATATPSPTSPQPTSTLLPTSTPIPGAVSLQAPDWERQDINNCGPASLAMYLRYWGWGGDQFEISDMIKPNRKDRNVNVEELVYYMRNRAGWLNVEFRVGGDIELLKRFLAEGIPVMVEEGVYLEETYWPGDDHWAAHYLLLTAYDDALGTFTAQDSFFGDGKTVSYSELDENWRVFNRVYILVYPPDRQEAVIRLLGKSWDIAANRQYALEQAQGEIDLDPQDAVAWFNLGSNLVYFERYEQAAGVFDTALSLELPQRMLRYQFTPFIAYFHTGRTDDLLALADYALKRTPNAEEALLWHGWANYRLGNSSAALQDFYQALEHNPAYQDAQYAIDFVRQNP